MHVHGGLYFVPNAGVHDQPQSGRLDGAILRIMSAEGRSFGAKAFPRIFTRLYYHKV